MKKLTVGIIGGGKFFSNMHAPVLASMEQIERIAIANPDSDHLDFCQKKWGFQAAYTNADEMLSREQLDCVYVITPPELTPHYAALCIVAGIPSFVEKPIGGTAASLTDVLEQYEKHKTQHFVAFNRRFSPIITRMKKESSKEAGISQLAVDFFRHDTRAPNSFMSSLIHAVDTIRFLCGEIESVHTVKSSTEYFDNLPIAFNSVLSFSSGISGSINYNCRAGHVSEKYTLFAENRSLIAELSTPGDVTWEKSLHILEEKGLKEVLSLNLQEEVPVDMATSAYFNGIIQEHTYFLDCVQRKLHISQNIEDSIKTMQAAFAIGSCYSGKLSGFAMP
jgi:virulence factor